MTKTPQFDKAIAEYFAKLDLDEKGGAWRTCSFSGEKFYLRPVDIEYYKERKVPLPTLSQKERTRRKLAQVPLFYLFKRKSSLTGKEIISDLPPTAPFPVYEADAWFGEAWDPLEFGAAYDPKRPFFEQYREFQVKVPRRSLYVDKTSTNSEYTNQSNYLKNCYFVFDSYQSQDSFNSNVLINSRECADGFSLTNCEQCFECFESQNLYKCKYVDFSKNCLESSFLLDCRDCEHCFMSANLRHKKYYFMNKPLSKEEYEKEIKKFNFGSRKAIAELKTQFAELKSKAIYKENHNERSVNCVGDFIKDSKNCYFCFYMLGCENMTYSLGGFQNKDCYDAGAGAGTERAYDSNGGMQCYNISFTMASSFSRDLEYCDTCSNCHDCFGCIGLKNKSFCIMNRQYTEEEYWKKVDEIKTQMLEAGEYGEFFPPYTAPIPYNICAGASYEGYDDIENAAAYGYPVEEVTASIQQTPTGVEVIDAESLPDDIQSIDDSLLEKILLDKAHNKRFRLIKAELDFYRRHSIPIPTEHPSIRLETTRKKIGPIIFKAHDRTCNRCHKKIQSVYPPEFPGLVYCESCYNNEIS